MVDYSTVITARKEYEEVHRRVRYHRSEPLKITFLQRTLGGLRYLLARSSSYAKPEYEPTISTVQVRANNQM